MASSALLLALCAVAHAAPTSDLVTSLPGWAGALKSPMYSGYVEVSTGLAEAFNRRAGVLGRAR